MEDMYYIGLDVHKKTISYCVKDGSGHIHAQGAIPATRLDLDRWMKILPQPWTAAMEATFLVPATRQRVILRVCNFEQNDALCSFTRCGEWEGYLAAISHSLEKRIAVCPSGELRDSFA